MREQIFLENESNENKISIEKDDLHKYLIGSARWAKFIAIVGYVVTGFLLLTFLMLLKTPMVINIISVLFNLIVALVTAITLERFGSNVIKWSQNKETEKLKKAIFNLKNYFMFIGIFIIIVIILLLLLIILVILRFSELTNTLQNLM